MTLVDRISDRGIGWPNEDAAFATRVRAFVFDGVTAISRAGLMDSESDVAWLVDHASTLAATFDPEMSLEATLDRLVGELADTFEALQRRPPAERFEVPTSAMMAVQIAGGGMLDCRWFGDCAGFVGQAGGEPPTILGNAVELRIEEDRRVRAMQVGPGRKLRWTAEQLQALIASRNAVNSGDGKWLLAPDRLCSVGARHCRIPVKEGDYILLATDGFHALTTSYALLNPSEMIEAVVCQGLDTVANLLRAYEATDSSIERNPRYKESDDATAVLLRVAA